MKSHRVLLLVGVAAALFAQPHSANAYYCVLRSWTSPALPGPQQGLAGGNCTEGAAVNSRQYCNAWCNNKLASVQTQITADGPLQYPFYCVWGGAPTNTCSSITNPEATTNDDLVYPAPKKCQENQIKIDNYTSVVAARGNFTDFGLSNDVLASRVMERTVVAWARNCRNEINSLPMPIFDAYQLRLTAAKEVGGAISFSVGHVPRSTYYPPIPIAATLTANQGIYAAAGGSASSPAYLACQAVWNLQGGASRSDIQLCRQNPEIDTVFEFASSPRVYWSGPSLATQLSAVPTVAFPAYQRKLLFDMVSGAAEGEKKLLVRLVTRHLSIDTREYDMCIFRGLPPTSGGTDATTGCSFPAAYYPPPPPP